MSAAERRRATATSGTTSLSSPGLEEKAANLERTRRELETALGWAEKRIEFYGAVDAAVQLAIAEALRHAAEIKAQTEKDAQMLLEKVAAEKAGLVEEIEALHRQRASLQQEVAELRAKAEREAADLLSRAREDAAAILADAQRSRDLILDEIATLEQQFSEVSLRVNRFLGKMAQGLPAESSVDLGKPR